MPSIGGVGVREAGGVFLFTNCFAKEHQRINLCQQGVIAWGGIRGALAAAAVLLVPETYEYAHELQAMTAGVILASFILNGMTVGALLKKLGIVDFTQSEKFQSSEARLIINEEITLARTSYLRRITFMLKLNEIQPFNMIRNLDL